MTATDPHPELAVMLAARLAPAAEASSPALAGEAGWRPAFAPAKAAGEARQRPVTPRGFPAKREGSATERLRTRPNTAHDANARGAAKSAKRRRPQRASMTKHDIS